jgi:hypothetical protein
VCASLGTSDLFVGFGYSYDKVLLLRLSTVTADVYGTDLSRTDFSWIDISRKSFFVDSAHEIDLVVKHFNMVADGVLPVFRPPSYGSTTPAYSAVE